MDFINEYALLIVVALPVAIVAGLNVVLAMSGESGTLLLPSLKPFPSINIPEAEATPEAIPARAQAAANDEEFKLAA